MNRRAFGKATLLGVAAIATATPAALIAGTPVRLLSLNQDYVRIDVNVVARLCGLPVVDRPYFMDAEGVYHACGTRVLPHLSIDPRLGEVQYRVLCAFMKDRLAACGYDALHDIWLLPSLGGENRRILVSGTRRVQRRPSTVVFRKGGKP